ncbi:MAG: hypothetical protein WA123_03570 [Methylotenera sp.]
MLEIILWVLVIAVSLILLYRIGKKKNGFVKHSSRGAYMRDLNKEMEDKESK